MNLTDVIEHKDFNFALGSFLDEFKRSDEQCAMLEARPQSSNAGQVNLCILAAVAHHLAIVNNLSVPKWVDDPQYKMPHPVFAFDTKNKEFQEFLIQDTPITFASKNIFHGANAIERA
ncbi:MAG: hypothetical protein FWE06_01070 [Oscillospiraceae bacterium]|nr:hypothetical protein [Oscillospiraceae bacterium]